MYEQRHYTHDIVAQVFLFKQEIYAPKQQANAEHLPEHLKTEIAPVTYEPYQYSREIVSGAIFPKEMEE
ncbi:MAG: hypothetical protein BWY95_02799 [Bacteroidetes bacterium ADurb.BinA104]|nr:MAG: hypothetical protein BWY95_02799 [Bacteroidetes bacterium ADurb.BinA104]